MKRDKGKTNEYNSYILNSDTRDNNNSWNIRQNPFTASPSNACAINQKIPGSYRNAITDKNPMIAQVGG